MNSVLVVNVVGLTSSLLGERTPHLRELAASGFQAELGAILPAVTCSAQATMLTGSLPRDHGIVGNGWYFRDLSEVWLWRQSNHLVERSAVWERARERKPDLRCAQLFWWYNMHSSADVSVTPRPAYFADGRKAPDIYTHPPELRDQLQSELGKFPLFNFWGPAAGIRSSDWIGRCGESILQSERPELAFVYLPHLDYDMQRFGPHWDGLGRALEQVDAVVGRLIDVACKLEMEVIVVSEYGITEAENSVSINRVLRAESLLAVHDAQNGELLDAGASRAFAVSDHQIAHVYIRDAEDIAPVRRLLESTDGIDFVLDADGKRQHGLDHPRSGELIAVADERRWFDYYYWLDDTRAPDFARTVDIHSKPGYDPAELLLDPSRSWMKARVAGKLLRKALGFRYLMDVIPLDASLIKGTHGRLPSRPEDGPILISSSTAGKTSRLDMTEVSDFILERLFGA